MRIVGDFDRRRQDQHVANLVAPVGGDARPPKVIDRRAEPVQGYRAVHVIVFANIADRENKSAINAASYRIINTV